jgi:poly-gamma-glutamate biosynthesis protein PgsC/CapC
VHDYLVTAETVRFACLLGIAVAMLLYDRLHLTTGSIVVPGYLAVFTPYPPVIIATFANAFISYVFVNHVLHRRVLLYGRTKFTVLVTTSIVVQIAMLKLSPSTSVLWESDLPVFIGVGYIVPALIAHDMGRQGVRKTIMAVSIASVVVAVPIGLALVSDLPGVNDLSPIGGDGELSVASAWIPLAVLLSALASWGIAVNHGWRSGGFIGAAFVGMLMADPWQVAIVAATAVVTYLVVTRVLMDRMILFGRRKFSAMMLIASSISWSLLWFGERLFGEEFVAHYDLGALALTPLFVPGLLANDAQRTSPRAVVLGTALGGTFVVSTTWTVQAAIVEREVRPVALVIAVATFLVLFWPQLELRRFVPSRPIRLRLPVRPEPIALAVTVPRAASVPPTRVVPVVGHHPPSSYARWAATHPEAAADAEAWLESVLAATTRPRRPRNVPSTPTEAPARPAPPYRPSPALRHRMAARHRTSTNPIDPTRLPTGVLPGPLGVTQSAPLPVRSRTEPGAGGTSAQTRAGSTHTDGAVDATSRVGDATSRVGDAT